MYFKYSNNGLKTEAIAKKVSSDEVLATREVILRHGDSQNKVLGRKYAFKKLMTHVMENSIIPNVEVGELWKLFGNNCRQPNIKLAY